MKPENIAETIKKCYSGVKPISGKREESKRSFLYLEKKQARNNGCYPL
jgi:hypothetical protein